MRKSSIKILIAFAFLGLLLASCQGDGAKDAQEDSTVGSPNVEDFTLSSAAFPPGGVISRRYTCDGDNISPELNWIDAPQPARSFALIMDDPDAPGGTFTHWVLYNLPGNARGLAENLPKMDGLDNGALQGRNDFDRTGYGGPCPPRGTTHHYRFRLYALDTSLDLPAGAAKSQVLARIDGHVIGQAEVVGTYRR